MRAPPPPPRPAGRLLESTCVLWPGAYAVRARSEAGAGTRWVAPSSWATKAYSTDRSRIRRYLPLKSWIRTLVSVAFVCPVGRTARSAPASGGACHRSPAVAAHAIRETFATGSEVGCSAALRTPVPGPASRRRDPAAVSQAMVQSSRLPARGAATSGPREHRGCFSFFSCGLVSAHMCGRA